MTKTERRAAADAETARRAAGSLPIVAWTGDSRALAARCLREAGTARRDAGSFPGAEWARFVSVRAARGWLAMARRSRRLAA